jgi:uncharacterized protein YjiS (DUF1127 family)
MDSYAYQRRQSNKDPIMNAHSCQPSVLSPPLTGRAASEIGNALRAVLVALWRIQAARRREARAVDAVTDMNEHMLKDIGAHDRLIAHAAARKNADYRRRIAVQLSTPLLLAALIAAVPLGAAAEAADLWSAGGASANAQVVGSFTGEYVNGAPVYRLPPVIVVAGRQADRAALEREKQSMRAQQARSKAAAKNPA